MRSLCVNDTVRLIHGVPNDFLPAGTVGVIQSIWGGIEQEYEVEFRIPGTEEVVREVLKAGDIKLEEQHVPDHGRRSR